MQGNVFATERDVPACFNVECTARGSGGRGGITVECDAIVEEQQRAIRETAVCVVDIGGRRSEGSRLLTAPARAWCASAAKITAGIARGFSVARARKKIKVSGSIDHSASGVDGAATGIRAACDSIAKELAGREGERDGWYW